MPVQLRVTPEVPETPEQQSVPDTGITIKIDPTPPEPRRLSLNAKRTIDGNILVFDHIDIDLIFIPEKRKIMALPKELMNDNVYSSQTRFFDFLFKKGLVNKNSIKSGNVYGSLEAKIPEPSEQVTEDVSKLILVSIHEFMELEKDYMSIVRGQYEDQVDRLTDPDHEDSTELGEVPHKPKKGSLIPGLYKPAFTYYIA